MQTTIIWVQTEYVKLIFGYPLYLKKENLHRLTNPLHVKKKLRRLINC